MLKNIDKVFERAEYSLTQSDAARGIFESWQSDGTLQRVADAIKADIKAKNANASGAMSESVNVFVEIEGTTYKVVFSAKDYFDYVDKGRAPGKFPPPKAIEQWIKVKPVVPYADARGRIPTLKQLTFLICRAIWRNGIKPRNFTDVLNMQSIYLRETFENQMKK